MNSLSRTGLVEFEGLMRTAVGATSCCRLTRLFTSILGKNNPNGSPLARFPKWEKRQLETRIDFKEAVQDTTKKRLEKEEKAVQKKD